MDEVGSRIQQADDAGFRCQVFADLVRGEFISLLWPVRMVSAGSEVRLQPIYVSHFHRSVQVSPESYVN